MQILDQQLWGGAWDSVFLIECDVAGLGTALSTERKQEALGPAQGRD